MTGPRRPEQLSDSPAGAVIANEFAAVRLSIDRRGNAPRLRIDDLAEGRVVFLDAFELSALTARSDAARADAMVPRVDFPDE